MTHIGDSNPLENRRIRPTGYTFPEFLVVFAMIAMLLAMLLPAVQQAREAARRVQCQNNLVQIGIALTNYTATHDVLPPGSQDNQGPIRSRENGGYHMGWLTQLLPYLEKQNAHAEIDFTSSVYDPVNLPVRQQRMNVFVCPSAAAPEPLKFAWTNYSGVNNDSESAIDVDRAGVLFLNSAIRYEQIRDGSSNTLFVVECRTVSANNLGWMSGTRSSLRNLVRAVENPRTDIAGTRIEANRKTQFVHLNDANDSNQSPAEIESDFDSVGGPGSSHRALFHVLLGDGTVRAISHSIDPATLRKLAHRADGEMVPEF